MDCYRQVNYYIEISYFVLPNKTGILPSCSCVSTTVYLHHLVSNETFVEKDENDTRVLQTVLNKS